MVIPKIIHNAVRAISSRRIVCGSITNAFNGCDREIEKTVYSISHRHHFSTDARKKIDGKLAQILKSEIKSKELFLFTWVSYPWQMPEPPPDFPFTIEDIPGKDKIYLSRHLGGEKITAEVKDLGRFANYCVALWVKVAKGDATLNISLCAYSDGFEIEQIAFKDQGKQDEDDRMDLHRYNFWTEFVRVRGFGDPVGVFLFDYMTKRKDQQHLFFLKKLNEFVTS